jgi:hypothetical protein
MNLKNLLGAVGALAIAATASMAQGPLYDKVIVDLPYSVTIGNKVLQPGNYVIRQNPSEGGGGRVLLIYSDKGRHFETSAMTIPTLDTLTPKDTRVVLHRFGNDYYFDKVWIQGKNYGYEFPLPESVKSRERERMQPVNVAARYEATTQQQARNETRTETAPAPPAAERQQEQTQTEVAQATPPPTPAPAPQASPAPAPAPTPAPRRMPHTDAGWLTMMLSGGLLSVSGLALRRRI